MRIKKICATVRNRTGEMQGNGYVKIESMAAEILFWEILSCAIPLSTFKSSLKQKI